MVNWESVGPVLSGGDVFSLATSLDAGVEGMILAGTGVGLHLSRDGGYSWQLISGELGAFPAVCVALSPGYPRDGTIVVGGAPGMLLRSPDGGQTWQSRVLDIEGVTVTRLVMSPAFPRDGSLLAGTAEDGIHRSTDYGRHWEPVNFGLLDLQVVDLAMSPAWEADGTAFAIVGDGLFQTTNQARAWKAAGPLPVDLVLGTVMFSPGFGRDATLLLGTANRGIWRSQDRGENWAPVEGTEDMNVMCLLGSARYEQDRTLYAGTVGNGVLVSHDGGLTWEALGKLDVLAVFSLAQAFDEGGELLVAGVARRGTFRLGGEDEGWIWTAQNLAAHQVATLTTSGEPGAPPVAFAGGSPGLFLRSDNMGESWQLLGADVLPKTTIHLVAPSPDFSHDGLVLVASADKILRLENGGRAWTATIEVPGEEVRSLIFSPGFAQDRMIWACTGRHMLRSENGGVDWSIEEVPSPGQELTSMALSPQYDVDRTMLVATSLPTGGGYALRLWRSTDGVEHGEQVWEHTATSPWMVLTVPGGSSDGRVPYDGCIMAAGGDVFVPSGEGSDQWVGRRLPDGEARVLSLLVTPEESGHRALLAGTTRGLFVSLDEGMNWERPEGGPGLQPIMALAMSPGYPADRSVWLLAAGGALWRCRITRGPETA